MEEERDRKKFLTRLRRARATSQEFPKWRTPDTLSLLSMASSSSRTDSPPRSPLSRRARGRERERRVYFRWDGVKVKRSHVPRAAGTPFNWDVRQNWDAVEFRTDSLLPLPLPPRRSKNGFRGSSRGGNRTDFGNDASGGSLPMCVG